MRSRRRRAHPRAGGENSVAPPLHSAPAGSSPRGRGKHQVGEVGLAHQRLIPARAGKTRSTPAPGTGSRAHPRAGGENESCAALDRVERGSSPRGRGKRASRTLRGRLQRLIPARAGKTLAAAPRRVRAYGSSPRGRGKRHNAPPSARHDRLIPARAGKTTSSSSSSAGARAHPRAGGENARAVLVPLAKTGSSPRGRGKRARPRGCGHSLGLIPARAGKTFCRRAGVSPGPAHPRAGGENRSDDSD